MKTIPYLRTGIPPPRRTRRTGCGAWRHSATRAGDLLGSAASSLAVGMGPRAMTDPMTRPRRSTSRGVRISARHLQFELWGRIKAQAIERAAGL